MIRKLRFAHRQKPLGVPCCSMHSSRRSILGSDPAKIRDWAQAAEDLGYAYIEVPDHVFGATLGTAGFAVQARRIPSTRLCDAGFLAAVTKNINSQAAVLIAPQRQTGVIASRRGVDLLSGGRLRLGIGLDGTTLVPSARRGMEDSWSPAGRTSPGAAPPLVRESREL